MFTSLLLELSFFFFFIYMLQYRQNKCAFWYSVVCRTASGILKESQSKFSRVFEKPSSWQSKQKDCSCHSRNCPHWILTDASNKKINIPNLEHCNAAVEWMNHHSPKAGMIQILPKLLNVEYPILRCKTVSACTLILRNVCAEIQVKK